MCGQKGWKNLGRERTRRWVPPMEVARGHLRPLVLTTGIPRPSWSMLIFE